MRRTRIQGYIDEHGEVIEGMIPVLVGQRVPSPYGDHWMQVNQHFLEEFAARRDIGNEVLRVFLYLNARLDFENIIQIQQTEIADRLGMQPPNVHRALKRLEDLGIILRGPKVGRSSSWRLNRNAGWKGKIANLRSAEREQPDLRLVK